MDHLQREKNKAENDLETNRDWTDYGPVFPFRHAFCKLSDVCLGNIKTVGQHLFFFGQDRGREEPSKSCLKIIAEALQN